VACGFTAPPQRNTLPISFFAIYRRVLARLFSRDADFLSASAARLAMDPFEKKPLLSIEVMIALAINVVVAILGYYAIMMWRLYTG
jgi:hypothetical protein